MKKEETLVAVRPESFDVHLLRQAAREGRLFIQPKEHECETMRQQVAESILGYVMPIRECASPQYATRIDELWKALLEETSFYPALTFQRGKKQGLPNKYRITALVAYLLEKGVYRPEFSMMSLHLRMEHTSHRTAIYQGMTRYYLERPHRVFLNRLLAGMRQETEEK